MMKWDVYSNSLVPGLELEFNNINYSKSIKMITLFFILCGVVSMTNKWSNNISEVLKHRVDFPLT